MTNVNETRTTTDNNNQQQTTTNNNNQQTNLSDLSSALLEVPENAGSLLLRLVTVNSVHCLG